MRLLSFFIAALIYTSLSAQEYKPLLIDGRVWKLVSPGGGEITKDLCYEDSVCGDTVVDGRVCKRIHSVCTTPEEADPLQTDYYYAAFEENRMVYQTGGGRLKKLDFNLHAGDQISNRNEIVMSEDSIEVRGKKYRRLTFNTGFGDASQVYWVEGIGASQDFWYYSELRPTMVHCYFEMAACYDNGKLVFTKEDFSKEPLPSGITTITDIKDDDSHIYSIAGMRISHPQKNSLYIKNGKKHMMR